MCAGARARADRCLLLNVVGSVIAPPLERGHDMSFKTLKITTATATAAATKFD